jgi:hypothetical protein
VPVGGVAWDYLQYVVGLARLGHDVFYHEDTFKWPYHPVEGGRIEDGNYSANFINDFFQRYAPELCDRWHYLHLREHSFGMTRQKMNEIARTADCFLNVSGSASIPDELSATCKKIFIDTDPGYNQIRMAKKEEQTGRRPGFLRSHDQYFTYAENIHSEACLLPALGVQWKTTRMPIVLDLWNGLKLLQEKAPWSTVMTWSDFQNELLFEGQTYGSKAQEFEKIIDLPRRSDLPFQIAVGGNRPPYERLSQGGWNVLFGPEATQTAEMYREFIAASRGEISVSKNVYVALRTGWFSCRSACYLAAGRPVVVQNTGFDRVIPTGKGVVAFDSLEDAIAALSAVETDYDTHAKSAREIAAEYFDSNRVLKQMLNDIESE